jgi:hypothetical protein
MQTQALDEIFSALQRAEVDYLIVGGLAVVAHGYVRTTGDVDLVIGLEPENIIKGLRALESIGYRIAIPVTAEEFADAGKREQWRREKGMMVLKLWSDKHQLTPVDVFVYEPFDMQQELAMAERFVWNNDLKIPVISKQTLITMKREAGRPQDMADIAELEKLDD